MDNRFSNRRYLFCLAFVLLACGFGCGRAVNRTAERRIRDSLPLLIGSAKNYEAHVDNYPDNTLRGKLKHVTIDGEMVSLKGGLLIDSLHLDIADVQVDTGKGVVRKVGRTEFVAVISQNSIDEYLAGEAPDAEVIQHMHVTLRDNLVTFAAKRMVMGVGMSFSVSGPLRIEDEAHLKVDARRMSVVGISFPSLLVSFLKERFETGVDLSSLPFSVRLKQVRTERGRLVLSGEADVAPLILASQRRQR